MPATKNAPYLSGNSAEGEDRNTQQGEPTNMNTTTSVSPLTAEVVEKVLSAAAAMGVENPDPHELVEDITVACDLPECLEATHSYVSYDPQAIDPHRALRIDHRGTDRDHPADYWIEVGKYSGDVWRLDLYATECFMDASEVANLIADVQRAHDLAAKLNAQDAEKVRN